MFVSMARIFSCRSFCSRDFFVEERDMSLVCAARARLVGDLGEGHESCELEGFCDWARSFF